MLSYKKGLTMFSALTIVLMLGALNCSESQTEATPKQESLQKAYNFELKDLDGNTYRLSDFRGKVVILDFWDTWCPPCRQEIPGFVELHNEYKDKDFVMIGVAFARYGPEAVRDFMKEYNVEYINLIGDQQVVDGFGGITSIPTTFVIDKKGNIYKKHVGFKPKSVFEKEVKTLLEIVADDDK
jgi:cytochrome c biogenesis protein CcmG/thiol:disulfide interchange protein DsbE